MYAHYETEHGHQPNVGQWEGPLESAEASAPVTVVGDIHGQFYDLIEIFRIGGYAPYTNYLFLGDYVDRGLFSVETISPLTCLKLRYPDRVQLIRGNLESRAVTQTYGFYTECVCHALHPCTCDLFTHFPHEGPMADLVWSDPDPEKEDFAISPRGAGYSFGSGVVHKFLETNGMIHILRAHQLRIQGYASLFDNHLSTLWSAPNYCYRCGNSASILEVSPMPCFVYCVSSCAPRPVVQPTAPRTRNHFRMDHHHVPSL
ncbi:Metallo-dependent phosphatase-like protein [Russula vinacea]|nr:Metallo-dependent phosphatase-like protein [Russula vinacea]